MTGELRLKLFLMFLIGILAAYVAFPGESKPLFRSGEWFENVRIVPGIDLAGGAELWVTVDPKGEKADVPKHDLTQKVIEVLRRRINIKGLKEPRINTHGEGQIQIQLAGHNPEEIAAVRRIIETVGELKFMVVAEAEVLNMYPAADKGAPPGHKWYPQREGNSLLLEEKVLMSGDKIESAFAVHAAHSLKAVWAISFTLKSDGRKQFGDLTTRFVGRRLAIVLDNQVQSAPNIKEPITQGQGEITGSFTRGESEDLATTLRSGSLPCPIEIVGENLVGASLGRDAIEKGLLACGLSFAAICVFMIVYYRILGVIALVAVVLNILWLVLIMSLFGATMTLPGLAGIALTIGMAVDSNVLIYERLREEREKGKSILQAFENGFDRAWTTIIDSNLTTLIAGVVLYYFGTEQVRGFAVTLSIGIATTLITAVTCTKIMLRGLLASGLPEFRMMRMFASPSIPFLRIARSCVAASLILIAGSVSVLATHWEATKSIEFKGGTLLTIRLQQAAPIEEVRRRLLSVQEGGRPKYPDAEVQAIYRKIAGAAEAEGLEFQIRTSQGTAQGLQQDIQVAFAGLVAPDPIAYDEAKNRIDIPRDPYNGGTWFVANLAGAVPLADAQKAIRDAFSAEGLDEPRVAAAAGAPEKATALRIELKAGDVQHMHRMAEVLPKAKGVALTQSPFERVSSIGSTVANDLLSSTYWALAISWFLMIVYIWFRFQHWPFGAAAIIALVHDVLISAGMVGVARAFIPSTWGVSIELGTSAMAALLTVVGYSINDTIVVFDRIRENLKTMRKEPSFSVIIETSINQTLSRTIITSFTVFLVCLVLFGITARTGGGVSSFAWPMLVGVVVGTYSSIYIAGALLAWYYKGKKPTFE